MIVLLSVGIVWIILFINLITLFFFTMMADLVNVRLMFDIMFDIMHRLTGSRHE